MARPRPTTKTASMPATMAIDPAKLLALMGQEDVTATFCADGDPGKIQVCVTATVPALRIPELIAGK